jgi:hypothetical protein
MEIKKITVGDKEYEFVNEYRNTRHGFAHDTTLFINNVEKVKHTCNYSNRTWECYRFQTVMCGAVRELIDNRRKYLENKFKEDNGYTKLTDKRRLALEDIFDSDKFLVEYEKVLVNLRNY